VSSNFLAHVLFTILLILPLQAVKGIRALDRQVLINRQARFEFYRMAINGQWLMMLLVIAAAWGHGPLLEQLGIAVPNMSAEDLAISIVAALLILSQSPVVPAVRARLARSPAMARSIYPLRNLLPRSTAEKERWIGVSITAGICEEIIFRGFLFLYFQDVLGLSLYAAVVLSSLIFGLSHYYQGLGNVIRVSIVGALLAVTYAISDSLAVAIALHIALDLGGLYMGAFVASDDQSLGPEDNNTPTDAAD